jgi:hypothetical protein
MKIFLSFLLITLSPAVFAWSAEISGNLEAQFRQTKNNDEAKEDLFQNWDQDEFQLFYGNLNTKFEFKGSRLEANWFVRHSRSDLYRGGETPLGPQPYFAPQIFTFPNRLVVRDVFKLQEVKTGDNYKTESIINKLFYEWSYDEHRFTFGRMYINYGIGEIFNPINPFNQPTGLTAINQVAQGSDGLAFKFFVNDKYTVDFYLLGDKRIEGYDGQIDKTLWAHGEYQVSENLQLDYVIGEDQNRHKLGGQVSYRLGEGMIFTQILYQSEFVTKKPSDNLWDIMLGYDHQLTSKWHLRSEGGYQKLDRLIENTSSSNIFGDRFLPTEYFIALANVYEIHPLVKLSGTLINDIKSGFTYFIAKSTFSLGNNVEAELFGYSPVAKGDSADNDAQKLVTTDVGAALRAFF